MIGDLVGGFVLERGQEDVFQRGVHLPDFRVVLFVIPADVEELEGTVAVGREAVFLDDFLLNLHE